MVTQQKLEMDLIGKIKLIKKTEKYIFTGSRSIAFKKEN